MNDTFPIANRRRIWYTHLDCVPRPGHGAGALEGMDTHDDELLNLGAELGYELMVSGAEVYRVEDSVGRLLRAYGRKTGEVFAIPNCLIVSLKGEKEEALTRVRRIPSHGTDIDRLERCNALCRALCRETPPCAEAEGRLEQLRRDSRGYTVPMGLAGYFLGAFGFCLFFQGSFFDAVLSGMCSLAIGLCLHIMGRLGANPFFKSIAASAVSAFLAIALARLSPALNQDTITIGALMALVPGVCFTSAMRDIMAGDMMTGLCNAAEGILIGVAVVIGTGAAMALAGMLWGAA